MTNKNQCNSANAIEKVDISTVIGTTGEVMPAYALPYIAKEYGAMIVEINPFPSQFTHSITDMLLQGNAGDITPRLIEST